MCPSCRYGHSWKVFYGHKNPNAQFSPMRRDDDVQQNPAGFLNRRPIFERFPVHLCWWVVFHQTIKHWLGSMRKLKQGNVMDTLRAEIDSNWKLWEFALLYKIQLWAAILKGFASIQFPWNVGFAPVRVFYHFFLPQGCSGTYLTKSASWYLNDTLNTSRGYPSNRLRNRDIILTSDWLENVSVPGKLTSPCQQTSINGQSANPLLCVGRR